MNDRVTQLIHSDRVVEMVPVARPFVKSTDAPLLGKGRVTLVYVGSFHNSPVAIKKMEVARLNKLVDVVEIESTMRQLDHRNIRALLHVHQDDDFKYFVLELGIVSLADCFKGKYSGRVPEPVDGLRHMAAGLKYIHSKQLVHGGLRPSNVLVTGEGDNVVLKIADLGFSQLTASTESSSFSGVCAANNYAAPEILAQDADDEFVLKDTASDVFALGCIFYQFLTSGCHPFGRTFMIPCNILTGVYNLNEVKDGPVKDVVEKMIRSRPKSRPSMSQVTRELED